VRVCIFYVIVNSEVNGFFSVIIQTLCQHNFVHEFHKKKKGVGCLKYGDIV
jgi:hypothetical protein